MDSMHSACDTLQRNMLGSAARASDMPWSRFPCRVWPLPLDSVVDVAPAATFPLRTRLEYDFYGELMVIGSDQAPFTRVESMFAATTNQQAANGAQRGTVYSEIAQNNLLNFDCVTSGGSITVEETNTGAAARRMLTTIFGVVKKGSCG